MVMSSCRLFIIVAVHSFVVRTDGHLCDYPCSSIMSCEAQNVLVRAFPPSLACILIWLLLQSGMAGSEGMLCSAAADPNKQFSNMDGTYLKCNLDFKAKWMLGFELYVVTFIGSKGLIGNPQPRGQERILTMGREQSPVPCCPGPHPDLVLGPYSMQRGWPGKTHRRHTSCPWDADCFNKDVNDHQYYY